MSVRHKMRAEVEKLLKLTIDNPDFPREEEVKIYVVFIPQSGEVSEESIEISEQEIDMEDKETVKKFLERTTREALEADVKGLKLYGYVFEADDELRLISENSEGIEDIVISRIERMREEV